MKRLIRRQRPIPGGRQPLPACVVKQVWSAVDEVARRERVSRSWVIAVILADAFGIKIERFD